MYFVDEWGGTHMSVLQRAERCFANQQTFKALNAFVTPANDGALPHQRLRDLQKAEARSKGGESPFLWTL